MKISLIAARSANNVIGVDGKLPWKIPSDMKKFKQHTSGKSVLMGRKTFESIGFPLPNRYNVVLTNHREEMIRKYNNINSNDLLFVDSLEYTMELFKSLSKLSNDMFKELVIIGGESLYGASLSFADTVYLTTVDAESRGDTMFPSLEGVMWETAFEERITDPNSYLLDDSSRKPLTYTFQILNKNKTG